MRVQIGILVALFSLVAGSTPSFSAPRKGKAIAKASIAECAKEIESARPIRFEPRVVRTVTLKGGTPSNPAEQPILSFTAKDGSARLATRSAPDGEFGHNGDNMRILRIYDALTGEVVRSLTLPHSWIDRRAFEQNGTTYFVLEVQNNGEHPAWGVRTVVVDLVRAKITGELQHARQGSWPSHWTAVGGRELLIRYPSMIFSSPPQIEYAIYDGITLKKIQGYKVPLQTGPYTHDIKVVAHKDGSPLLVQTEQSWTSDRLKVGNRITTIDLLSGKKKDVFEMESAEFLGIQNTAEGPRAVLGSGKILKNHVYWDGSGESFWREIHSIDLLRKSADLKTQSLDQPHRYLGTSVRNGNPVVILQSESAPYTLQVVDLKHPENTTRYDTLPSDLVILSAQFLPPSGERSSHALVYSGENRDGFDTQRPALQQMAREGLLDLDWGRALLHPPMGMRLGEISSFGNSTLVSATQDGTLALLSTAERAGPAWRTLTLRDPGAGANKLITLDPFLKDGRWYVTVVSTDSGHGEYTVVELGAVEE